MEHHANPFGAADEAVIDDIIMALDPAQNPDERATKMIGAENATSRTQVLIHQSAIKVPDYHHPKGFLYLAWDVKFGKFVLDVQGMNDELIDRDTMEKLWVEHVYRHFRMDDVGIKSILEPALANALDQVKGYAGFDAEAYWKLQSVTTSLGKLLSDWRSKELQEYQKKAAERASAEKKAEDATRSTVDTSNQNPPRDNPQQPTAAAQEQTINIPIRTYTPYVHPAILRRKIDESYDFDEEDEDTEMS